MGNNKRFRIIEIEQDGKTLEFYAIRDKVNGELKVTVVHFTENVRIEISIDCDNEKEWFDAFDNLSEEFLLHVLYPKDA